MSLISFFCYETWLVFYLTCVWMMCTLFCHESSLVFYLTCVWMMCTLFCHNILFVIHFNFLLWYLISLLFDMCMNDVLFFCHDILSFLSLISIFLLWDLISLLFDVCMNDVHNFFVIIYFLSLISIFLLRNGTWLVFYLMCVWMICTLFCHNILFACHFIFFFLLWEFISILFEVSMNGVCTVFFFHFFFLLWDLIYSAYQPPTQNNTTNLVQFDGKKWWCRIRLQDLPRNNKSGSQYRFLN